MLRDFNVKVEDVVPLQLLRTSAVDNKGAERYHNAAPTPQRIIPLRGLSRRGCNCGCIARKKPRPIFPILVGLAVSLGVNVVVGVDSTLYFMSIFLSSVHPSSFISLGPSPSLTFAVLGIPASRGETSCSEPAILVHTHHTLSRSTPSGCMSLVWCENAIAVDACFIRGDEDRWKNAVIRWLSQFLKDT